ncbi:DEAD/DEAH box helicase [Pseudomarimonas arenosa]|uniref:DEAD/DEAH box helicase n=1 Tax=Pseudomarimonas arenosa TaxID=2774145 RepID=A0AAW3ZL08_9GAMM|nr:DEAD/DEAH box helicase [Pseudomarimonas arenosa]MBD8525752.1 DEAD/DEAH box helicase [Pseudomarimonas arenosa]
MPHTRRANPIDPRQRIAQAHVDLLLERFEGLSEHEKIAFELLAISDLPIRLTSLSELLRLTALSPYWKEHGAAGLARMLMLRLRELVVDSRAAELRAQGGDALAHAALISLVQSGRARAIAECLQGEAGTALERIEPEYRSGVRMRLRMAGLFGGLAPEQLVFGAYISAHHDPISDALHRCLNLIENVELELLDALHPSVRGAALAQLLQRQRVQARADGALLLDAAQAAALQSPEVPGLVPGLIDLWALSGARSTAGQSLALEEGSPLLSFQLAWQVIGRLQAGTAPQQLLEDWDLALKQHRQQYGNRAVFPGLIGKLHLACITLASEPQQIKRREQLVKLREPLAVTEGGHGFEWWQSFSLARMAGDRFTEPMLPPHPQTDDVWWLCLLLRWSGQHPSAQLNSLLEQAEQEAERAGWMWLVEQIQSLDDTSIEPAARLRDWLAPQARWQSALSALAEALAVDKQPKAAAPSAYSQLRVHLRAPPKPVSTIKLEVVEQRPKGNGWSGGRVIGTAAGIRSALDRLPPDDDPDRRLLNALLTDLSQSSRYGFAAGSRTVAALIDHPRLFAADDSERPLQAVAGEVELGTRRLPDGQIELRLEPEQAADGEPFVWRREQQVVIYRPDPSICRIAEIIGDGLTLPEAGVQQLLRLLPDLSRKLRVGEDLDQLGVQEVEPDSRLRVLLEPYRDGLQLRAVVRPLGDASLAYPPGQGPLNVIAHSDGQTRRAPRQLEHERQTLAALVEQNPALEGHSGEYPLPIDDPEAALDMLSFLQEPERGLLLEWREGKPMRVSRARGAAHLQLAVERQRDWFTAQGGLALDDGRVIELAALLRALPSAQGRYVRLDEEHVIELNSELQRRLQVLQSLADDKGRVQVSGIAAFALDAALDEESECDEAFRQQLQRMREAETLSPSLPMNFQAELRDYQIDGYRFLLRLASWEAGACLADDMGLGKTVQALAALAARAHHGPALVVAPTSVIGNWQSEARRFAPDLRVMRFDEGDRERTLRELRAGDVLLLSYGLLAANIESLAEPLFATLVLDEAQAIKNASTQRAQAARQLRAQFRMALTGTPLENHLGELWSLFRVLNPGLLGSEEQFRRRFIAPLENDPRDPQREHLRRLLSPFLLRRTKAEVLAELPPRTEIVLQVPPSRDEAELLAALRRQAKEKLANPQLELEQRRVHVLAELTRLRRAACHPQLVAPELGLSSSKLEQLVELVKELAENHHRALVFSQFVDYLTLVRGRLEKEGVSYQYLDGSTPQRAREAAVQAFQGGSGEVFLLSLKAGGVGLNLTAADYVIHLDPWWNPAVEQQASDRAHRIGQTRPVTVYKLVLEGSIEQQILALHGSKRELIDQVIGGEASTGPVSVEELMELLEG